MNSRSAVGLALALLLIAAAAGVPTPAAAHINHVAADPQVSPDGTLVAESAFVAVDGYLVLHRNDGGEPGEPVGHVAVDSDGGIQTDVRVSVDPDVWAEWDSGKLWFVLHNDDGDGEFDPEDDQILRTFGRSAAGLVSVEKGERTVVTASGNAPQRTADANVTVRNATLPADGQLLVRNASNGRVLGRTDLSAGHHERVRVALNDSAVEGRDRLTLDAVVAGPDGAPVRAGDEPVATRFGVRIEGGGAATGTETPGLVRTATDADGGANDGRTTDGATNDPSTPGSGATGTPTGQPGLGVAAALAALAVGGLLARRRR